MGFFESLGRSGVTYQNTLGAHLDKLRDRALAERKLKSEETKAQFDMMKGLGEMQKTALETQKLQIETDQKVAEYKRAQTPTPWVTIADKLMGGRDSEYAKHVELVARSMNILTPEGTMLEGHRQELEKRLAEPDEVQVKNQIRIKLATQEYDTAFKASKGDKESMSALGIKTSEEAQAKLASAEMALKLSYAADNNFMTLMKNQADTDAQTKRDAEARRHNLAVENKAAEDKVPKTLVQKWLQDNPGATPAQMAEFAATIKPESYSTAQKIDDTRSYWNDQAKALLDPEGKWVTPGKEAEYKNIMKHMERDLRLVSSGKMPSWMGERVPTLEEMQQILVEIGASPGTEPTPEQKEKAAEVARSRGFIVGGK